MIAYCVDPVAPDNFREDMAGGNAGNLYDLYGKEFDEQLNKAIICNILHNACVDT